MWFDKLTTLSGFDWLLAQNGNGTGPPSWVYALIGVALLLVLVLPRRLARRSSLLSKERLTETDRLKRSMQELLVQLQEVSREVNASLDTKMIALNELIQEAEAKIRELKELLGEESHPQAPTLEGHHENGVPERERAESDVQPGPTDLRGETEMTVLRLADEGKTELEIAQQTGIPRGEIELVLALRRKTSPPRDTAT